MLNGAHDTKVFYIRQFQDLFQSFQDLFPRQTSRRMNAVNHYTVYCTYGQNRHQKIFLKSKFVSLRRIHPLSILTFFSKEKKNFKQFRNVKWRLCYQGVYIRRFQDIFQPFYDLFIKHFSDLQKLQNQIRILISVLSLIFFVLSLLNLGFKTDFPRRTYTYKCCQ